MPVTENLNDLFNYCVHISSQASEPLVITAPDLQCESLNPKNN